MCGDKISKAEDPKAINKEDHWTVHLSGQTIYRFLK